MLKKLLFLLLCILMLVVGAGIAVSAASGTVIYSGLCGDKVTWSYDTSGTLTLSGEGKMWGYSEYVNPTPWRQLDLYIHTLVIEDGVSGIGAYAFSYCSDLKNIIGGDFLVSIGHDAFRGTSYFNNKKNQENGIVYLGDYLLGTTSALGQEVSIREGTTIIADYAFSGNSLTSVTIPDTVKYLGMDAFSSCTSLKNAVIGDSVETIGGYAFYDCINLRNITIGDSVKTISAYAFYNCYRIESIVIPESVTAINEFAFDSCSRLTDITIGNSVEHIGKYAFSDTGYYDDSSNWENNVLYIGNYLIYGTNDVSGPYTVKDGTITIANEAFGYYNKVTELTIPDSVKHIGTRAFCNSDYLTKLVIGDSVKSISESAFFGCGILSEVYIGASVEFFDNNAFDCCWNITEYTVSEENPYLTAVDNVVYNKELSKLVLYPIGNPREQFAIPDTVTDIAAYAFDGCNYLKEIIIPDSITVINDRVFYSCDSLTGIVIPDTVTAIKSYAFAFCSNLKEVTIGSSVTSIGNDAFYYNKSLTDIVIPESVTRIGYQAFRNCENLINITIGSSVTDIDAEAFIATAYFDNSDNWEDGVLYIGDYLIKANSSVGADCIIKDGTKSIAKQAFKNLNTLKYITLPDSIVSISSSAFEGCGSYATVDISDMAKFCAIKFADEYANPLNLAYVQLKLNGTTVKNLSVPAGVSAIGDYAFFAYGKLNSVVLPETVSSVGDYAFANCSALGNVTIPASVTEISETAFEGSASVNIICSEGTVAHEYALAKNIAYTFISCDHLWGDWVVTAPPTEITDGIETRTCALCSATQKRVIYTDIQPVITVDNYTVYINRADRIRDMRFAVGEYSTPSQIKAAEGNVALSNAIVVKNTVDGLFEYIMPDGGYYTFWIRMNSGKEYFLYADMTKMKQEVIADGVTVTIKNLYGVKDFFIAEGDYDTYADVKANYMFNAASAKIGAKHDYAYTAKNPGIHTVLVRYKDTARPNEFIKIDLTVDEPVFMTNGLQVTVGNIPDVKVIRTAYGEYSTPGELKKSVGSRSFSGKSAIRNAEEYTIQYREEGIVTIIVEYNNGYIKVFHYDVQQKTPTVEQNGNRITFGDLDGLNVIRYAEGEYTASKQIKNAVGSKYLKSEDIVDGYITVTLDAGTYTFCVQYDDESYNYYTVAVE